MPAPSQYTYSTAIKIEAQTALKDALDAGSSNAKLFIKANDDTILSTLLLTDPCGTINGDGSLTLTFLGPDTNAAATGTAGYGEFVTSDNVVCLSLPVVQGESPKSGYLVMNTPLILAGGTVSIINAQVG